MEMIELVLPKRISKELNFIFDFILDPLHHPKSLSKNEANSFFDKVIFNSTLVYNPWTRAICVYCSWKNNETGLMQKLKLHKPRRTLPGQRNKKLYFEYFKLIAYAYH